MDYSKQRRDLIIQLIEMNNFFMVEWNKSFGHSINLDTIWNKELVDINFNRYTLVEESSHEEENFSIRIKVRYNFRSGEANKFGKGHQYFYDRFKETVPFNYDEINDINKWKEDYLKEIENVNSNHNNETI